jgi:hypothetical protein
MRRVLPLRRWLRALAATSVAATLAFAGPALAAPPIHVILPTVTAPPGATVAIPIDVDQSVAPYAVTSIGYQLGLDPSLITGASFNLNSGLITTWGTPFTNANATVAAALGVGFAPVTSTATRIQTVYLTVGAAVPAGTNIPLAFQSFTFNDGSPAVTLGTGIIQVRTSAAAGNPASAPLALDSAAPNPTRGATRVWLSIPDDGSRARVHVSVLDLSGRVVRTLADEAFAPGRHELSWDGRGASGARVAAGAYWLSLERAGERRRTRIVVVR